MTLREIVLILFATGLGEIALILTLGLMAIVTVIMIKQKYNEEKWKIMK